MCGIIANIILTAIFLLSSASGQLPPASRHFPIPETTSDDKYWSGRMIGDLSGHIPLSRHSNSSGVELKIIRGDPDGLFRIDGFKLYKAKVIDRETVCRPEENPCTITLGIAILVDTKLYNFVTVTIEILDRNDNAPTFEIGHFSIEIPGEAIIGDKYELPRAIDLDIDENGLHGYQLKEVQMTPRGLFYLDASDISHGYITPKMVLNRALTPDTPSALTYQLLAFDSGVPLKSGSVEISVKILEPNMHSPRFLQPFYNVSCFENISIASVLVTIEAYDNDVGDNGRVSYYFKTGGTISADGAIEINEQTGEVLTKSKFDFETRMKYSYEIIATDHANPPQSNVVRLTVNIMDVNDCPPEITIYGESYDDVTKTITVPENSPLDAFVAMVTLNDVDSGQNGLVKCNLNDSNLRLDSFFDNTYQLVINSYLDYEEMRKYDISMYCHDQGVPSIETSQRIGVFISDVNDNKPQFERDIYNSSLREGTAVPMYITRVCAHDNDSGLNGQINYFLQKHVHRWLSINQTSGELYAISAIDREQFSELEFEIIAIDLGDPPQSSSAKFILTIIDANDEAAIFDKNSYSFGAFENQEIGTEVGMVSATDRDTPPFSGFYFYVLNNTFDSLSFSIDAENGTIRMAKELDRETRPSYFFYVGTNNTLPPYLTSKVSVTVHVRDRNDNKPVILFPNAVNTTAFLPIWLEVGASFARVQASDADADLNARLTYTITDGNQDEFFSINSLSGALILAKELPSFNIGEWDLTILVEDSGEKVKLSAECSLKIILDVNTPFPGKSDLQNGVHHKTKSANISFVEIAIIVGFAIAVIVTAASVSVCLLRYKSRINKLNKANYKQKNVEFDLEEKIPERYQPCGNIYDTAPFIPINKGSCDEEQRKQQIDSILGRTRLNAISESPTDDCSIEEMLMEGEPLDLSENEHWSDEENHTTEDREVNEPVNIRPMEPMSSDKQLYKLIQWLKEVQKTEKRMSETATEVSLPDSNFRYSSIDDDSITPIESSSAVFDRQEYLKNLNPNNTLGHFPKNPVLGSPTSSKFASLPQRNRFKLGSVSVESRSGEGSFDNLDSLENSTVDSDKTGSKNSQNVYPQCGLNGKKARSKDTDPGSIANNNAENNVVSLDIPVNSQEIVDNEDDQRNAQTLLISETHSNNPEKSHRLNGRAFKVASSDFKTMDENANRSNSGVNGHSMQKQTDVNMNKLTVV